MERSTSPTTTMFSDPSLLVTRADLDRGHVVYMAQQSSISESIKKTQQTFNQEIQNLHASLNAYAQHRTALQHSQERLQESNSTLYSEFKDFRSELQKFMQAVAPVDRSDTSTVLVADD
ncbi:hypothetical protein KSP40_PGU014973 [Platanthera guangdongensis]|uniref:Uncharacterized protein n=1 Tax=Platanthera guangdongensis TaxID=2320717 RepID=A0ABR2MDK7_9ASPA